MSTSVHSPAQAASEPEFVTNWSSLVAAFVLLAMGAAAIFVGLIFFGPAQPDQPKGVAAESVGHSIHASGQKVPESADGARQSSLNQMTAAQPTDQPANNPASEDLAAAAESTFEVEYDQAVDELVDDSAVEESLLVGLSESPAVPDPIMLTEPPVELPNELPSKLNTLDESQLVVALGLQTVRLDVVSVETNNSGIVDAVFSENYNQVASQRQEALASLNQRNDSPGGGLAERRSGISGLPFRNGDDCRLDEHAAKRLGKVSRELGREKSRVDRYRQLASEQQLRIGQSSKLLEMIDKAEGEFVKQLDQADQWRNEEAVPALEQILQAESTAVRLQLVKILSQICGTSASQSLARRALYDASPDVRDAANNALVQRPPEHFRWLLIKGLRYPWVPVSQHAAESLVALDDQGAIEQLVELLDEPNPTAPHQDGKGNWVTNELVCVNHLRSCVMCHASSTDRSAPVRGVIPTPGKPLPQAYYSSSQGQFVRADVTYLKQDFSVQLEVPKAHPWPDKQRFDFFVRTREGNKPDRDVALPDNASYPQRDAVLFALRKLTGKNVGNSSEAWRRLIRGDG